MSLAESHLEPRKGARRMADVPVAVRAQLSAGSCETVNLMEWLAADMGALARAVALSVTSAELADALRGAARGMLGAGVTTRLRLAGAAIASNAPLEGDDFGQLASHPSDLVRQWACYAVNDSQLSMTLSERLAATLPFATDRNMSVREAAWMAFRPHVAISLDQALDLLAESARHANENVRRLAVEVTRPRSVWGAHIDRLKREPGMALRLLDPVRADESRYVRLAVGNWLNDASKTRPDWVESVCARWAVDPNPRTAMIVKRALRTVIRQKSSAGSLL